MGTTLAKFKKLNVQAPAQIMIGVDFNGKFWAASGNSLYAFDPKTRSFQSYSSPVNWDIYARLAALGAKLYVQYQSTFYSFDPATETWTQLANHPAGYQHNALVADDTYIYSYGGADVNGYSYANVYRYNPSTDAWTSLTNMPEALHYHGYAAAQVNGNWYLYSVGGYFSNGTTYYALHRIYKYDVVTGTWSNPASLPGKIAMYNPSYNGAERNGKLYWVGGRKYRLAWAIPIVWDPSTDQVSFGTPYANFTASSYYYTYQSMAVVDVGGSPKMYLLGGNYYTGVGYFLNNFEWDPATDTWASKAAPPFNYHYQGGAALEGSYIWIFGGFHSQNGKYRSRYNPATDSWSNTAQDIPYARRGFGIASVVVGSTTKIYLIAGQYYTSSWYYTNRVDVFDTSTLTWSTANNYFQSVVALNACEYNGKVYAAGGHNGNNSFTDFGELDPTTGSWTRLPNLPYGMYGFGMDARNGKIYFVGGRWKDPYSSANPEQSRRMEYDLSTKTFSYGGFPVGLYMYYGRPLGRFGSDGKFYAHISQDTNLGWIVEYDPATDSASLVQGISPGSHSHGGGIIRDGFLYLVGGSIHDLIWRYDTLGRVVLRGALAETTVSGQVVDDAGVAVSGARVLALGEWLQTEDTVETTTDANGNYSLVLPGQADQTQDDKVHVFVISPVSGKMGSVRDNV